MIGAIERWLESRSRAETLAYSAVGLTIIGILDYVTGPEIGFSIFYVIPVFAVTWRIGGRAGILTSLACSLVWSAVDLIGRPAMSHITATWNVLVGYLLLSLFTLLISRIKLDMNRLKETTEDLQSAMGEVKRLTGLLRVCAWCRRVRTDAGEWVMMESYMKEHSDLTFTHGICPDCVSEHYPDYRRAE